MGEGDGEKGAGPEPQLPGRASPAPAASASWHAQRAEEGQASAGKGGAETREGLKGLGKWDQWQPHNPAALQALGGGGWKEEEHGGRDK